MLGGGMRQAGILAAAGLYALENHIERLADDHSNAQKLATGISAIPGVRIAAEVPTNMVYFDTTEPAENFTRKLLRRGVSCLASGPNRVRMVTHLDVSAADVGRAIDALRATASAGE
jgi:threonine aldolase